MFSSVPADPPGNLTLNVASNNFSIFWSPIDCIERNGLITNYTVDFQPLGGESIIEFVMDESYTASDLTPNTNYSFRVAGVNSDGRGPYSEILSFVTDGKYYILISLLLLSPILQIS